MKCSSVLLFGRPTSTFFAIRAGGGDRKLTEKIPFSRAGWAWRLSSGMQGDDPKYFRVVSTPKHYAVHSGPEPLRHGFNVDVSPHDLEDTYLPAFRATVTEAHAQSVMCAYNAIDGAPACANTMLLRDHLRDAWKFDGYVVSDCAAIADVNTGHHYAPDMVHAAAAALKAGTDLECGFREGQAYPALVDAVHQNLIAEADVDQALHRLFRARFELGMFDPPSSYCVRQYSHERGQLAPAPAAFAASGAGIDRTAEESRPNTASETWDRSHRCSRSNRRAGSVSARELQRPAACARLSARWNRKTLPVGAHQLRTGLNPG